MRPSDAPRLAALFVVTAWFASAGCTPRCQETCTKVLDCGLGSTRVAYDECVISCQRENDLYTRWEDEAKEQAWKDHKQCLGSATCDEIAAGVCYDDDLFAF